ncbi:porin [Paraburkholderia sp. BCC1884]|uniref:porin n=1 Tax=Paraburkholderia sp. BCC1884 TaxID=2562668 RepID=UPI0011827756|nr:porin [Paraburkholderia sp. BCC1884]
MKKSILSIATLGALCGVAHAQSSVTLYGLIDEGLTFTSNAGGHQQYAMSSGELHGSRWGLRGAEDLGGGMKAIFTLENGFDLGTGKAGQGGLEWGRQAFVGLSSPWGTLTFGRQYDSVVDYMTPISSGSLWGGYLTSHPGDLDNTINTQRTNNAIKYKSLSYSGFTFEGVYSLGGVAGDFTQNQIFSLGAGYVGAALNLAVAYLNIRNPNASFYGNSVATLTAGVDNETSPVYSGFASAHTQQIIAAAGAYTFGSATLGMLYTNTKYGSLSGITNTLNPAGLSGSVSLNDFEVNFRYMFTPAAYAGVTYNYTDASSIAGKSGAKYNQVGLAGHYLLSKRTDLYIIGVYQKASGTQSNGKTAVASITTLTPSATDHQGAVRIGICHTF